MTDITALFLGGVMTVLTAVTLMVIKSWMADVLKKADLLQFELKLQHELTENREKIDEEIDGIKERVTQLEGGL